MSNPWDNDPIVNDQPWLNDTVEEPAQESSQGVLGYLPGSIARGFVRGTGAIEETARQGIGTTPEDFARRLAETERRIRQFAPDEETRRQVEEIQQAGNVSAAGGILPATGRAIMAAVRNPSGTLSMLGESLGTSVPSLAGMGIGRIVGTAAGSLLGPAGAAIGGIIGGALGGGTGSFATEYGSAIAQRLAEQHGVDLTNEQSILGALRNPDVLSDIRQWGSNRGIPVAIFDALSMGLAGRLGGRGLGRVGRETGMQAGAGMAGEAAGQLNTEGRIGNMSDIVFEGLGEVMTGPVEARAARREQARTQQAQEQAAEQEAVRVAEQERQDQLAAAARVQQEAEESERLFTEAQNIQPRDRNIADLWETIDQYSSPLAREASFSPTTRFLPRTDTHMYQTVDGPRTYGQILETLGVAGVTAEDIRNNPELAVSRYNQMQSIRVPEPPLAAREFGEPTTESELREQLSQVREHLAKIGPGIHRLADVFKNINERSLLQMHPVLRQLEREGRISNLALNTPDQSYIEINSPQLNESSVADRSEDTPMRFSRQEVEQTLQRTMRRVFGNDATINSKVLDEIYVGDHEIRGAYIPLERLIEVSMRSPNALTTIDHEVMHMAEDLILKPDQKLALYEAAVRENWYGKYGLEDRYYDAPQEIKLKEAIAARFVDRKSWGSLPPAIRRIFNDILRFLRGLRTDARKMFGRRLSANDVFSNIERGRYRGQLTREQQDANAKRSAAATQGNVVVETQTDVVDGIRSLRDPILHDRNWLPNALRRAKAERDPAIADYKQLSALNKYINTHDHVAAIEPLYRPVYTGGVRQQEAASRAMVPWAEGALRMINRIPTASRAKLMKIFWASNRLETPATDDGNVVSFTMPEDDKTILGLMTKNEKVTLTPEESKIFRIVRAQLDAAPQAYKNSLLARYGLPPDLTKANVAEHRKALEAEHEAASGLEKAAIKRKLNALEALNMGVFDYMDKRKGTYFPQMRMGKAIVVFYKPDLTAPKVDGEYRARKDTDTYLYAVDSKLPGVGGAMRNATKLYGELKKHFPASEGWVPRVKPWNKQEFLKAISPREQALDRVEQLTELLSDPARDETFKRTVIDENNNPREEVVTKTDLLLEQLVELKQYVGTEGFKARLKRRKGYEGYVLPSNAADYVKGALNTYAAGLAYQIGSNETYIERLAARNNLIKQNRPDLYKFAADKEFALGQPEGFYAQMKNFAFNWLLGFNLASALRNSLGTVQTTVPVLSTVAPPRVAAYQGVRALKDAVMVLMRGNVREGMTNTDLLIDWSKKPPNLTQPEWAFLRRLWEDGDLSPLMTHEMVGQFGNIIDTRQAHSKIGRWLGEKADAVIKAAPYFFASAEQMNRIAAALATFRVAQNPAYLKNLENMARRSGPFEFKNFTPVEAAKTVVNMTQYDMTRRNRPWVAEGAGGVALQFLQWPLATTQLFSRMIGRDRAGAKFLASFVTGIMLTAGLMGLPGGEDLDRLVEEVTKRLGWLGVPRVQAGRMARTALYDGLRELGLSQDRAYNTAEAVLRGPSRLLGFDLSNTGIQFGLSNLFNAQPGAGTGPFGSIIFNAANNFGNNMAAGRPMLAFMNLLPAFMRGPFQAEHIRPIVTQALGINEQLGIPSTGIAPMTSRGMPRGEPGQGTLADYGFQALGFTPTTQAREREMTNELRDRSPAQDARARLGSELVNYRLAQRLAAEAGMQEEAARWQRRYQEAFQRAAEADRNRPPHERVINQQLRATVERRMRDRLRGQAVTAFRQAPIPERRRRMEDIRSFIPPEREEDFLRALR